MNRITEQESAAPVDAAVVDASMTSADAWQRRFGVPWERVERAVRAVSDRAVAASRWRFADLTAAVPTSEARPS